MNKEPKYYAYRADLKRFKEFYSREDAAIFFKTTPVNIRVKANGTAFTHKIGGKIGERWFIFDADIDHKDVQFYIEENQNKKYKVNGYVDRSAN